MLVLIDIPDFGPEAYDQMTKHMDAHVMNEHPSVGHTAALGESGGLLVADIWNSPEAFAQFAQEQIGPAAAQIGLGEFEPRMLPVRNRIRGKVTENA